MTTKQIPIADLVMSENYRKVFDKKSIDELAESLKEQGMLQPMLARPITEGKQKGKYEVVFGMRRLLAAQKAALKDAPCQVAELSDDEVLQYQMIENSQRENPHPMDEAVAIQQLITKNPIEKVSTILGKTVGYLTKRLALTNLIKEAQTLFLKGGIEYPQAMIIAKLQPAEQLKVLEQANDDSYQAIIEHKYGPIMSAPALIKWIDRNIMCSMGDAPFSLTDADLVPECGACVVCPKRTKTNPNLFDDMGKNDMCTDPVCYNKKIQANIKQKKVQMKEKHGEVLSGALTMYGGSGTVKVQGATVHFSEKPGDNLTPVVITKNDSLSDKKRLGRVVYVDPKELQKKKDHNDAIKDKPEDPKNLEAKLKEQAVKAKSWAFRHAIAKLMFDKIKAGKYKLNTDQKEHILNNLDETNISVISDNLAYVMGIRKEMPAQDYNGWESKTQKEVINKLTPLGIEKAVLTGLYLNECFDNDRDIEIKGNLANYIKICGLDLKKEKKKFSDKYDAELKKTAAAAQPKKEEPAKAIKK